MQLRTTTSNAIPEQQVTQYRKAMDRGITLQFLGYYLAVGPTRFPEGPHEVVMQFVSLCNLKELTTYAVLS